MKGRIETQEDPLDDRPDPSRLAHWIRVLGADQLIARVAATSATRADSDLGASRPAAVEPADAHATRAPEAAAPRRSLDPAERRARLETLRAEAAACTRCGLCQGRNKSVFADGDDDARILFVGEGPGADEDRSGIPFVGRAGQLLTRIIEGAMGMPRSAVYIANVVKCRPPENRNPSVEEQTACAPFLREQIELVQPDLVISLGKIATQFLLGVEAPMGRLRGRIHRVGDLAVLPTWHPAYLLRNPAAKGQTWSDIKIALGFLGLAQNPPPYRPQDSGTQLPGADTPSE